MSRNESGKIKKSKKFQAEGDQMPEKLTKEETQVARYLRLKCPNKQGNLNGIKVEFFIGSKLVDSLMESKFGPGTLQDPPKDAPYDPKAKRPLLETRHACFKYMQILMQKGLFARAIKIYKEPVESSDETPSSLRKRKAKDIKEDTNPELTPNKSSPQGEQKEPKRKFKLEIHENQRFVDEPEPYVWSYDPTSTMSSIIGALLILGSIGICCFPLWPSIVREGVYYLSLSGCAFLGSIVALAVVKYIIFACLWILTLGTIELWIFPNLTEDVGFIESFIPVYRLKVHAKQPKESIKSSETSEISNEIEKEDSEKSVTAPVSEEVAEKKTPKAGKKVGHSMKDLSESTVEVIKSDEPSENMEKIQEDYDFELVDDVEEDNK